MEMNEMSMGKRIYDVNICELLKNMCRRWHIIAFSGLVFTVLMVMVTAVCKRSVITNGVVDTDVVMEVTAEEAIQIENMLDDDALQEIDICMERIERMKEQKKYMNESVLMQLDPYECKKLSVIYEAYSDSVAKSRSLTSQYISYVLNDEEFSKKVSEAIGDYEGEYHISDVITAIEEDSISQGSVNVVRINISVVLLPEWDEEAVLKTIRQAIESYQVPSDVHISDVEFQFVKFTTATKYYEDIKKLQNNVVSQYNTDTTSFETSLRNLDRASALLYNYYLTRDGVEKNYMVTIAKPSSVKLLEIEEARGVVDKIANASYVKMALLGCFAGGLFASALYVIRILILGKAGRILGIASLSDKPLYGVLRLKSDNIDSEYAETIDGINYCMNGSNADSIYFLYVGKLDDACLNRIKTLCEKLTTTLNIPAKPVSFLIDDPRRYRILTEIAGPVIFCIAFEKNTIKEVYKVDKMLSDGNINVIGSIGIE